MQMPSDCSTSMVLGSAEGITNQDPDLSGEATLTWAFMESMTGTRVFSLGSWRTRVVAGQIYVLVLGIYL